MPPVPPSPPDALGGVEPPASVSEAPGEPPAPAHAARMTESTTKRPGAVRFMAAWTPGSAGRFPSIPATMIPMRRTALPLALVLLAVLPETALAHGSPAPTPAFPSVLLDWRFDPIVVVLLGATAAAYLWAVLRVNRAHPTNPQPLIRTWLFMSGLVAIGVPSGHWFTRYQSRGLVTESDSI